MLDDQLVCTNMKKGATTNQNHLQSQKRKEKKSKKKAVEMLPCRRKQECYYHEKKIETVQISLRILVHLHIIHPLSIFQLYVQQNYKTMIPNKIHCSKNQCIDSYMHRIDHINIWLGHHVTSTQTNYNFAF